MSFFHVEQVLKSFTPRSKDPNFLPKLYKELMQWHENEAEDQALTTSDVLGKIHLELYPPLKYTHISLPTRVKKYKAEFKVHVNRIIRSINKHYESSPSKIRFQSELTIDLIKAEISTPRRLKRKNRIKVVKVKNCELTGSDFVQLPMREFFN